MHRFETYAGGPRDRRTAGSSRDNPNTLRMLALLGGHERISLGPALFGGAGPPRRSGRFVGRAPESDRAYYRRRSLEERSAADRAAGMEARMAHEELADLYAGLPETVTNGRDRSSRRLAKARRPVRSPRMSRQDVLLDEALKGTFPASDPVSVAFIR